MNLQWWKEKYNAIKGTFKKKTPKAQSSWVLLAHGLLTPSLRTWGMGSKSNAILCVATGIAIFPFQGNSSFLRVSYKAKGRAEVGLEGKIPASIKEKRTLHEWQDPHADDCAASACGHSQEQTWQQPSLLQNHLPLLCCQFMLFYQKPTPWEGWCRDSRADRDSQMGLKTQRLGPCRYQEMKAGVCYWETLQKVPHTQRHPHVSLEPPTMSAG